MSAKNILSFFKEDSVLYTVHVAWSALPRTGFKVGLYDVY